MAAVCLGLVAGCAHFEARPLDSATSHQDWSARSLTDPRLKAFLETNGVARTDSWPPHTLDFETLTSIAFFYSPSLDVVRAQWAVATAGRTTAAARPNPVLSASPGYNFSAASGVNPWIPGVNVDVPIEMAGKRGYRMARAAHLDEAARLAVLTSAWQVRSNLRTAVLDHCQALDRVELLGLQTESSQTILLLLQDRLKAGAVSSPEVATFRLAFTKSALEQAEAKRLSDAAHRRAAEWVGLPNQVLAAVSLEAPIIPPELDSWISHPEVLNDLVLGGRSELLALLAEYAAAQSALQLEIARQYPDIHLGSGYQWDQGDHKWSLAISVELPLLSRNQGPIAEAEARRKEVAARFLSQQARVLSEIESAIAQYKGSRRSMEEAEKLVETQMARAASVLEMFKVGGADSLEVETSRLETISSRLVLLDARLRVEQAAGAIEDALQKPFQALVSAMLDPRPKTGAVTR